MLTAEWISLAVDIDTETGAAKSAGATFASKATTTTTTDTCLAETKKAKETVGVETLAAISSAATETAPELPKSIDSRSVLGEKESATPASFSLIDMAASIQVPIDGASPAIETEMLLSVRGLETSKTAVVTPSMEQSKPERLTCEATIPEFCNAEGGETRSIPSSPQKDGQTAAAPGQGKAPPKGLSSCPAGTTDAFNAEVETVGESTRARSENQHVLYLQQKPCR